MDEHVSYKEGAKVGAPVRPDDLPAKPVDAAARGAPKGGAGQGRANVRPGSRDASLEPARGSDDA